MEASREPPTLLHLCIRSAIDNLRYMGDVGGVELHLLSQILPHCSLEQLTHIENCTQDMNLSPVTNDLWKRFYTVQFGQESASKVVRRMNETGVRFTWKQLFDAKTKERKDAEDKVADKLKRRYEEERAEKQRKQVKVCSKVPPSSRRSFGGFGFGTSTSSSSYKNSLLKKARMETNRSEAKLHAAARRQITIENRRSAPAPVVRATQPINSRITPSRIASRTDSSVSSRQQVNMVKGGNAHRTDSPVGFRQQMNTARGGNSRGSESAVASKQHMQEPRPMSELIQNAKRSIQNSRSKN